MPEPLGNKELIEVYKIARNSVEHFDKIMGVFRQIVFTFNGVFISSGLAFYLNYFVKQAEVNIDSGKVTLSSEKMYSVLWAANMLLAIFNLVLWLVEKHYHRYLVTTAKVAEHIEEELFDSDNKKRLTKQLSCCYDKWKLPIISIYIRSYDFLYLLPILISVYISTFLLKHSFLIRKFNDFRFIIRNFNIILILFCTCLIIFNYRFKNDLLFQKLSKKTNVFHLFPWRFIIIFILFCAPLLMFYNLPEIKLIFSHFLKLGTYILGCFIMSS